MKLRKRLAKMVKKWLSRLFILVVVTGVAGLTLQWLTWPDVAALADANPASTAFIDAYERAHGQGDELKWNWVSYSAISPFLKRAVLVAEDINFFSHDGFDRREIKAAIDRAISERRAPRGASTLTQQLAKNLWLNPSRNPWRKIKEAMLTRQLEEELDKRRIFEIYLNCVEFGPGIYGAEAASRHYFGIPAAQLNPTQAAQLAASLSRPSTWHPGVTSRGYAHRVTIIKGRMKRAQWLDKVI